MRYVSIILAVAVIFGLAACSSMADPANKAHKTEAVTKTEAVKGSKGKVGKNLIIYYSRRGQNYFNGEIRDISKGNTEYCVEFIRDAVGADVFEVETVKAYPADYTACTEEAQKEARSNARPELKRYLPNLDGYDNIFVCGPCWWGTYPCAVFTQLEKLDWQGKRVFALMTHEGSGLGHCERDLQRICQGASLGRGLAVQGGAASSSQAKVSEWAKQCVK